MEAWSSSALFSDSMRHLNPDAEDEALVLIDHLRSDRTNNAAAEGERSGDTRSGCLLLAGGVVRLEALVSDG